MKKLRHTSQKAYVRVMQVSEAQLFIFVEGKRADRYFYSKIAKDSCSKANVAIQVATASEIPEASGGKESLKSFHNFLKDQEILLSNFEGKKTAALFCADKDIDDLLRTAICSEYFVYTKTYDLEGTILNSGNIFETAASMAGLAENEVRDFIGNETDWLRKCAETWKEWLVICVYSKKHELFKLPGFSIPSQINREITGEVDEVALAAYIERMKVLSGYKDIKFERSFNAVKRKMDKIFREQRHHEIFKGKWYLLFIKGAIKRIAGERDVDLRALHFGLIGGVQMTVNHPNTLTEHFVEAVQNILSLLT